MDSNYVYKQIQNTPEKLIKKDDIFAELVTYLQIDFEALKRKRTDLLAKIDNTLPNYVEGKMQAEGKKFIPDANRTLRLTYGRIKGYQPADATYYYPFTFAKGMAEKNGTQEDYKINYDIAETLKKNGFGIFKHPSKNDVPLCMLYNTDTTGGNSGSPVLNSKGELVALNFDRTFEATINDYAWNDSYSRSIGLDMRFVLWVTYKIAGAEKLVEEMHVINQ
jgi:hypothetical protein